MLVTALPIETTIDQPERTYPLGLTLVYCDGLGRAGEQLSLADLVSVALGYAERLFPGGALEDPRMGDRHATLTRKATAQAAGGFDGNTWVISDRGHKSGTFVDGRRIREHTLSPGEVIRIGSTFMVFGHIAPRSRSLMLNSVGAAMAVVEEGVASVARTEHPVLLLGENGTGKELVAHEVHRLSGRLGPFLALNCTSLRGERLERALFGRVPDRSTPGAWTSNIEQQSDVLSSSAGLWRDGQPPTHEFQDGLLLRALDGTVFLDEVGEMEEAVQRRLLHVLETRTLTPVGATDEVPITTRIIAATNREVDAFGGSEHMLPELYAFLSRWAVKLPALRERKEDLGVLVRVLLGRGAPGLDVTPDLMAALLAAHWPLNIRGLVDVLTTARRSQQKAPRLDVASAVRATLEAQSYIPAPGSSSTLDLRKPL